LHQNDSNPSISGGFDLEDDSGFYFYDFQADAASGMTDDDGAYFSISY